LQDVSLTSMSQVSNIRGSNISSIPKNGVLYHEGDDRLQDVSLTSMSQVSNIRG